MGPLNFNIFIVVDLVKKNTDFSNPLTKTDGYSENKSNWQRCPSKGKWGWITNTCTHTQSRPVLYLMRQTVRGSYGGLANAANPIATLLFTAQTAFMLLI